MDRFIVLILEVGCIDGNQILNLNLNYSCKVKLDNYIYAEELEYCNPQH